MDASTAVVRKALRTCGIDPDRLMLPIERRDGCLIVRIQGASAGELRDAHRAIDHAIPAYLACRVERA